MKRSLALPAACGGAGKRKDAGPCAASQGRHLCDCQQATGPDRAQAKGAAGAELNHSPAVQSAAVQQKSMQQLCLSASLLLQEWLYALIRDPAIAHSRMLNNFLELADAARFVQR